MDEAQVPELLKDAFKKNPGQVYKSGFKVDPLALQMQSEVAERNYRAWRTMGTTGGMILWDFSFGAQSKAKIDVGPFVPGRRGAYRQLLNTAKLKAGQPEAESRAIPN